MNRDRLKKNAQSDARTAIIECAVSQFSKKGYSGTSLEDIAEELGVTKGAIYYHFNKKTEILYVIHDIFIDVLLDRVHERNGPQQEPIAEIRAVFIDVLWLMEHMKNYVRVFFEEMRELDDDQFHEVKQKRDAYEQHVADTYERGVQSNTFRGLPDRLPVFALFGMANWSYQWFREDRDLDHEQVAAILADIFLVGVCTEPDQVRHGDGAGGL